ncbi:MAG: tetratricopeptide repeat protein [Myxococcota bacterium]
MRSTFCTVLLLATLCFGAEGADAHVLVGARAFREGDWARALVEFRVALKLGAEPRVHWYEAAALARAERYEEAAAAFQRASELAPEGQDALFGYYRALACFEAKLFACALEVTTALERTAGPRVQTQLAAISSETKQLLATEPPRESVDTCFARAAQAPSPELRRLWLREAEALASRRADRHRLDEARRLLAPPNR